MKRFRFLAVLSATTLLLGMTGCSKEPSINIQELEQSLVGLWWDEFEYEDVTEDGVPFSRVLLAVRADAARGANLTSYTALGATAVSNWAVAQKSDYEAIFTNLGSTTGDSNGKTYDGNVNAYITTGVGGAALDGAYWSATEKDSGNALAFISSLWGLSEKTNSLSVRPVLGF